jgi:hypothetical protein
MKILVTLILFSFAGFFVDAQTGFYLVLDNKAPCKKALYAVDKYINTKFCVTDEAIIKESEFKLDSKILEDLNKQNQYFNIRFTKSGYETLKLICERLPEKQLVFVVKGKVAGTYPSKSLKPAMVIPITGKANSAEIKWVYENLNH